MARTLLRRAPGTSWRVQTLAEGRPVLHLEASEPHGMPAARLVVTVGERVLRSRFLGTLSALRAPHVVIAEVARFAREYPDGIIEEMIAQPGPVFAQTQRLITEVFQPDEIREASEAPAGLPSSVIAAQRRAFWISMREGGQLHRVDLDTVQTEGARFGSGTPVDLKLNPIEGALYAEQIGPLLYVVTTGEPDNLPAAMEALGCRKSQLVSPTGFEGLLCAFRREWGEEFGMGTVERVDWASRTAEIWSTAIPPVPVPILSFGTLRLANDGREQGELRRWQV
jgi:hypothetical protein